MSQSKRQSAAEAIAHTLIGFCVSFLAQLVVYPMYGARFTTGQNLQILLIFTLLSIVRSYVLRRLFNWLHN